VNLFLPSRFDERVSRLALGIGEETVSGLPSGQLYVQGLCIALLGILGARYSAQAQDPLMKQRRLSARQEQRVVELIRSQLGSKLSLVMLAREVGLSPQHFARLFKASFGTTPHQVAADLRVSDEGQVHRR
jgi:AraC family transcriptional regulator